MQVVAGIIPMNLGLMVDGNKELSAKIGVDWSRRQGMAATMALKVETGKEVRGWSEAGRRGVRGFVPRCRL